MLTYCNQRSWSIEQNYCCQDLDELGIALYFASQSRHQSVICTCCLGQCFQLISVVLYRPGSLNLHLVVSVCQNLKELRLGKPSQ